MMISSTSFKLNNVNVRAHLFALIAVGALLLPAITTAAVPTFTPFEGVLTSAGGGPVSDGPYSLTFAVYESAAGGAAVWVEGPVEVTCTGGRFVYLLGTTAPLDAKQLAGLKTAFLGVKVGDDPEFPRQPLGSVAYALHASSAENVSCTNCVGAASVGFNYAGSATKGGAAADLSCTGCVSVAEIKFDGDVDLAGQSIKAGSGTFSGDVVAKTVTAAAFVGDGSKLTGLKTASGSCSKAGDVVKGIKADGSLDCVSFAGSLPADGLGAVSNGVLSNVFVDVLDMPVKGIAIPDNTGAAATSNIDVPDLGTVRDISITVTLANTDLSTISMQLLPPDDKAKGMVLCDPCGEVDAKALTGKWTVKAPPKSGDLAAYVGTNAKGLWTLKVLDSGFCVPQKPGNKDLCKVAEKTDGAVADWTVQIETLSNSKVHDPNGDLIARVKSSVADALADTKSMQIDTKSTSEALVAQAWVFDTDKKSWLPAATGVDAIGTCTTCGSGKDGDYSAASNKNLSAGTYEYKDFIIQKGVTVTVTGSAPLTIKATGKVQIDGILELSGKDGQSMNTCCGSTVGGAAGPGGSAGGAGPYGGNGSAGAGAGGGAGGCGSGYGSGGGGGGYGANGQAGTVSPNSCGPGGAGGSAYGSALLSTFVGGSGGGGGGYGGAANSSGGGGGGGGGAVRIDAPTLSVGTNGAIRAIGGKGGDITSDRDGGAGGGGSGGAIWLRAAKLTVDGQVSASGGAQGKSDKINGYGGDGGNGGDGRVRFDTPGNAVGGSTPQFAKGDATGLGTLLNRFVMEQPSPGLVRLTNTSGQTHKVRLVVTY